MPDDEVLKNWPSVFWWYSHTIPIIPSRETKLWETTTSRTCRLSRVSGLNGHEMRWEGRNFEVISTDLVWTAHEAGKIWAILRESPDATCHQHAGSTCGHCYPPYGLITYLCICHTFFYHSLPCWSLQGCNYKVVCLHLEEYLNHWGIGARPGGKNTLGHRNKRFLSGSPCSKSVVGSWWVTSHRRFSAPFWRVRSGNLWPVYEALNKFSLTSSWILWQVNRCSCCVVKIVPNLVQIDQFWCK